MDPLISVINELRKLNTLVDNDCISLPQIVAVGAQSAGKSSTIEGIVGFSFLPRGNDIVTRWITGDWATLDHISNKNFTDFEEVENEIRNKVPPKQDIKAMVDEYVKNPKSLILAVTPANNDVNNSDALHIAKKYDPERLRTICVLTKIDLMDKGTNANDLLMGKKFYFKHGIIGVRCRSQEEVANKTSVEDCLKQEEEFFRKNYRPIARKCGMPYLREQLNKVSLIQIN
uniref:Dynamin GTPase domain-containing protein n=1 Tax=Panagrolaimus sp. ES5 TaxID=591445 RepID=A0AC34FPG3_9BILA